jgi:hypothetical protein
MIEDELREMFAARVDSPPPTKDRAHTVIRRARAVRRRRTTGTSVAAALVFVLAVAGVISGRGWWLPAGQTPSGNSAVGHGVDLPSDPPSVDAPLAATAATAAPAFEALRMDLRVGGELWSADGRRLPLDGVGPVTRAYRVPLGWVYGGPDQVRLLGTDGARVDLARAEAWVLSPDGTRLAFRRGATMGLADLTARGSAVRDTTEVPAGVTPVAVVKDRVVIASADGAAHDSWQPGGPFRPTWNRQVAAVYGGSAAGAVGLVRDASAKACIAALTPEAKGLRVGPTGACALGMVAAGAKRATKSTQSTPSGVLGPDGRWLALPTETGYVLVDVDSALSGREVTVECPVRGPISWLDATTAVGHDPAGAIACHIDGSRREVRLPAGVGSGWDFVPTLTPAPGD